MAPAGHVEVIEGTAAFTVSVTVSVRVLLVAAGALILIVPVYTLGARPAGFTVTVTVFSRPMSEMLPLGAALSQVAPEMLSVAESGAPLLDKMKELLSAGLGIGSPVV